MRKIFIIICLLATLSCQSKKEKSFNYSLETSSHNLVGSSDLIFDKPYHIINDTLFSFDSYQSKITKTPLNGEEGNELILSFSFDEQPSTFYYINSDSIVFSTGNTLFISDQKGIQYHSIRLFSKLDKNNQYLLQENHIF